MATQFLSSIRQSTQPTTSEPTGFPSRSTSTIAFNEGTRSLTLAPVGSSFDVVFSGNIQRFTQPLSVTLDDTTGTHYAYIDSSSKSLTSFVTTGSEADYTTILAILKQHVIVSVVYWNSVNSTAVVFGEERHGITMDGDTHAHLHISFGAQWTAGLSLNNLIVDGDGSTNQQGQIGIANGVIRDEDLRLEIVGGSPQTLSPTASIPTLYRMGSTWYKTATKTYPFVLAGDPVGYGGGLPASNQQTSPNNWELVAVQSNNYLLTHIVATNDIRHPIVAIAGGSYIKLADARNAATVELASIVGLPFVEFVPVATLVAQCSAAYTNTSKTRFVSLADGNSYVDWRSSRSFSSVTSSVMVPTATHHSETLATSVALTGTSGLVTGLSTTVPNNGSYIIRVSLAASGTGSTSTSTKLTTNVKVNGTTIDGLSRTINVITDAALEFSAIQLMQAGDSIEVWANSTSVDGALTLLAGSSISYIRVS